MKVAVTVNEPTPSVVAVVVSRAVAGALSSTTEEDVTDDDGPAFPSESATLPPTRVSATVPSPVQVSDTLYDDPEPAGVGVEHPVAVPLAVMSPAPMIASSLSVRENVGDGDPTGVVGATHAAVGPALSMRTLEATASEVGPSPAVPVTALTAMCSATVPSVVQVSVTVYVVPEPATPTVQVAVPVVLKSLVASPVTDWLNTTEYVSVRDERGEVGEVMTGVGLVVLMVTDDEVTDADGPVLPYPSTTRPAPSVNATVPLFEQFAVISTDAPALPDVEMTHGNAVPVTEKSLERMPVTDSEKLTVKTGLYVPTEDPGVVMVAVGAVESKVVLDAAWFAAMEFPPRSAKPDATRVGVTVPSPVHDTCTIT